MKSVLRIISIALLVAILLPIAPVKAQDGGTPQAMVAKAVAVYYQGAASGSFADQGDGTYLLTLENVGENLVWIMAEPNLSVVSTSSAKLSEQWAAAEGLTTDAVLEVGDLNVLLTLASPTFDAGTQTYVATVTSINAPEGVKDPELPMTFEAANLSIVWSFEFEDGLFNGITALYEGMRATPEECTAAKDQYAGLKAQYDSLNAQLTAAVNGCSAGDAAQCDLVAPLQTQLSAVILAIGPVKRLAKTC